MSLLLLQHVCIHSYKLGYIFCYSCVDQKHLSSLHVEEVRNKCRVCEELSGATGRRNHQTNQSLLGIYRLALNGDLPPCAHTLTARH